MNRERRKGSQEITELLLGKGRGVFKRGDFSLIFLDVL